MRHLGHSGKVDANHVEIVEVLRNMGCTVQSLAAVGAGCPDLLVGYRGRTLLIEVKMPGKKKTDQQEDWHERWHGAFVYVIESVEEARALAGAPGA